MLTAEQIKERATGIGASEIAAVFDKHKFMSQADLYMVKRGPKPPPDETVDMARGNYLEAGIADWTARDEDLQTSVGKTIRHPDHSIAIATPDRLIMEPNTNGGPFEPIGVLEIKSPRRGDSYERPEVDPQGVPEYIALQVQWQLGIACAYYGADMDIGIVSALIYGELSIYRFTFNAELFALMLDRAVEWWDDHVLNDTPPPIDGSAGAKDYLARAHPRHTTEVLKDSDPDVEGYIFKLKEAEADAKDMKEKIAFLQNHIKAYIGDAAGVAGRWGKITFKATKDREKWDTKALKAYAKLNDPEWELYRTYQPGSRVFRPTWK